MPNRSENEECVKALREISLLQHKIKALERERNQSYFAKKADSLAFFGELEEMSFQMDEDRKSSELKMRRTVEKFKNDVRAIRNLTLEIKKAGPNQRQVTASLLERMEEKERELSSSIKAFKEKRKETYKEYLKDEYTLNQELAAFEKRLEVWDLASNNQNSGSAGSGPGPASKVKLYHMSEAAKPAGVLEYEKFIERTGGERGGWEEYDHVTFVKHFTATIPNASGFAEDPVLANPKRRRVLDKLSHELAHRSLHDIEQHLDWYLDYLRLSAKRKTAIGQWRKEKDNDKLCKQNEKQNEEEEREIEDLEAAQAEEEAARAAQEEKRRRLREWREARQRQEQEARLQQQSVINMKKEQEKEYVARQRRIKEEVAEARRERAQEEELRRMKELAERLEADQARKALLREKRIVTTKKVLAEAQEKKEQREMEEFLMSEREREAWRRKKVVESGVTRDPSRLLQPTQGWAHRLAHNQAHPSETTSSRAINVNKIQQRAVPAWRANSG